MPLAAIGAAGWAASLSVFRASRRGVILVAGGLTALALMPRAGWGWTIPPQLLVGAGLGLTRRGLTELALRGRADQVVHGGWTIAARHAGVVLGLLLLAPILTSALEENHDEAIRAGAAVVLDSEIPPLDKLGSRRTSSRGRPRGRSRRSCPTWSARSRTGRTTTSSAHSSRGLQDQLDRAVTSAFSAPFLLAAALALCAARPGRFGRGGGPVRRACRSSSRWARRRLVVPVPRPRRQPLRADAGRRSVRDARAARRGGSRGDDRADRAVSGRRRRVQARRLARGSRARAPDEQPSTRSPTTTGSSRRGRAGDPRRPHPCGRRCPGGGSAPGLVLRSCAGPRRRFRPGSSSRRSSGSAASSHSRALTRRAVEAGSSASQGVR